MIFKSYLIEKNINLLDNCIVTLFYGENIGLKDDIKNAIKKHLNNHEYVSFEQEEIIKNINLFNEQVQNTSLFSEKKLIFLNEITDKLENTILDFLKKPSTDVKVFLFAQNLEKKSSIRKIFENDKKLGIVACYQDNERTLSEYIRKQLQGYSGLTQQMINFMISNSGLDRKTLFHETNKIKVLFTDKKIKIEKLPEVLNNNNNLDFNNVRDSCLGAEREKLNQDLGNIVLQNDNAYFYLTILGNRIDKLLSLHTELKTQNNIENAMNKLRPPIFWKDKPIFYKQIKKWNTQKLEDAKKILYKTEIQIRKNINLNNNILIKNLIIELYEKAMSTS